MNRSLRHIFGTGMVIIAASLLFPLFSAAESNKCGDNATFTVSKDGTLTVTGTGDMYDVDPAVNKYCTLVDHKDISKVKKIVISEGITSVGRYNFAYLKELKNVVLPSTLTRIGAFAFYNDEKLGNVDLPLELRELEQDCFGFCKGMTSVRIPTKVNSMDEVFFGCSNIVKAYIDGSPETLTSDYGYTSPFRECYKLKTIEVNTEHPYLYVKDGVLYDKETNDLIQYPLAKKNTDFKIPAETSRIKSAAILGAQYLDLLIVDHECSFDSISVGSGTWGDRTTKIAIFAEKGSGAYRYYKSVSKNNEHYYAFFELKRLKDIIRSGSILYEKTGSKKVNYLHNSEFNISTLKIADNVKLKGKTYKITSIEPQAFRRKDSLSEVILGKNISSIGKNAFKDCTFLTTVKVPKGKLKAYKKMLKGSGLSKRTSIV